jgi:hypothetical protein
MKWREISSGSFKSCDYKTKQSGDECLHLIKITGPISREERIPIYEETLKINPSENYFCIVDNSEAHENVLSYDDMKFFGDMLSSAGIKSFYCAVITFDKGHARIGKLTHAIAILKNIRTENLSTTDPQEAEKFIFSKIEMAVRND